MVSERNGTARAVVSAPGFVGRDREMTALGQALTARPAVVWIDGEAGIGKSRLLREYLATPAGRASRVLMACCPPLRHPHTLGPVVDAVRQAADRVAGLPLSPLAGALRPLFPEWAGDLPPAPGRLRTPQRSGTGCSGLWPSCWAVLQAAAVLSGPAGEATLRAVAGLAAGRAHSGLCEALGGGLIDDDGRGQVTFRHVLACQAVYDTIPAPRRRLLHCRAGRALECLTPQPVA